MQLECLHNCMVCFCFHYFSFSLSSPSCILNPHFLTSLEMYLNWTSHPCLHAAFDFQNEVQVRRLFIPFFFSTFSLCSVSCLFSQGVEKKANKKESKNKNQEWKHRENYCDKDFRYLFPLRLFVFLFFSLLHAICIWFFFFGCYIQRQTPTLISMIWFFSLSLSLSLCWIRSLWESRREQAHWLSEVPMMDMHVSSK